MIEKKTDRTAEMQTFLQVARLGSLSAAGRELGLSPSAISRVITRLEARLGIRLIIRSTRKLHLTQEGEEYALAAGRILNDLDQTEQALADRSSPKGLIRVSAVLGHGRLTIVPLLPEFLERYPDIKVELQLSDQLADVESGSVDIAIRFGQLIDSPLSARKLSETRQAIVASPEYLKRFGNPQHPDELIHHNCLDFSFRRINPGWPFLIDGQTKVVPVSGNIQANNGETLVQLTQQGVGITRLGCFHVQPEIDSGKLVPILEDFNPGDSEAINAVFIGGANMPMRVRVFVDYLVEKLGGGLTKR